MGGKFQYIFPGISVPAFLFFGFGSVIGIWKVDFMNFFKRYKTMVFVAFSCSFIVIFLTTHYKIETDGNLVISNIEVLNSLYIIASIPTYLLVADRLSKCKLTNIEGLATVSFTLYACHWLVLDIMRRIIHKLIQGEMMFVQFSLYIVPCLIAIVLYAVTNRHQRLKLLLSGGR
jgi:peptidoglycan/LPS O-acetylase OafA/YrhL